MLLGALLLRAVALGAHALWLDEGATWSWAIRSTWGGTLFAEANHPPGWWLVTRAWIGAFGDSESALRMPAALLGVVTVWLGWCLAMRLLHPQLQPRRGGFSRTPDPAIHPQRIALWFAGLLAISAFMTEYAQEARMYSLLIAEALGLALLYLRWLDDGKRRWLVSYALLAAAALYTHYFALWILVAHGAHVLWIAWRSRGTNAPISVWPMVVAGLAAGLLFAPWIVHLLGNYESISTGERYEPISRLWYVLWRMGAGGGVVVVDRARQQDGIGATVQDEWVWIAITTVLWFIPLLAGTIALRRRRSGLGSFVAFSVFGPILCCLIVFPVFQLIHERYLVFIAPWLIFVAVFGARTARAGWQMALTGALCVLFALGALAYHGAALALVPHGSAGQIDDERVSARYGIDSDDALTWLHNGHPYGKEPWRQAHDFVQKRSQPGDLVLLHPGYLHLVWDYYDRGRLPRILLPRAEASADDIAAEHGDAIAKATRVFLVLAHEETKNPNTYADTIREVVVARWMGQGMHRFQQTTPIWFDRSWGVRLVAFNRRNKE